MQTVLIVLIVLAMLGTVVALVRGIIQFLKTSTEDLNSPGPNFSGERQNKMMRMRIAFQAAAVILVILLLALSGTRS
jgi:hypothetical protein